MVSSQVLYSYAYELEKAAVQKYGCSEERAFRRLPYPYTRTVYISPEPADSGKKLKGEEVLVPDEIANTSGIKKRSGYFGLLQKKYDEIASSTDAIEGATLEYQQQLSLGKAYPNMQKITADEILAIFDAAKIYEGFDYGNDDNSLSWVKNNLKEVQKIQYFADAKNTEIAHDSYWIYWPDADTVQERKQEVQIFSEGSVYVVVYDENGKRVSREEVFNLRKKVQKMKDEGIPFDEYPLKRKVTANEVKAIFESAEIDPDADYHDKEVCIAWTMKNIKEIEKIQPFPDRKTENDSDTLYYCY